MNCRPIARFPTSREERDPQELSPYERQNNHYVVFWHTSGSAALELSLPRGDVRLMAQLGKDIPIEEASGRIRVPLAGRQFLECKNVSHNQLTAAFQTANLVKGS